MSSSGGTGPTAAWTNKHRALCGSSVPLMKYCTGSPKTSVYPKVHSSHGKGKVPCQQLSRLPRARAAAAQKPSLQGSAGPEAAMQGNKSCYSSLGAHPDSARQISIKRWARNSVTVTQSGKKVKENLFAEPVPFHRATARGTGERRVAQGQLPLVTSE